LFRGKIDIYKRRYASEEVINMMGQQQQQQGQPQQYGQQQYAPPAPQYAVHPAPQSAPFKLSKMHTDRPAGD
jgi:hypothetical protein